MKLALSYKQALFSSLTAVMVLSAGEIFADDDNQSHVIPASSQGMAIGSFNKLPGTGQNTQADFLTGLLKGIAGVKTQSQPAPYQQPGGTQQWIDPAFLNNPGSRFGDYDHDGVQNQYDRDIDGDGVPNEIDHFPVDNSRS